MPWSSCHALAFSARGTCAGSRYGRTRRFLRPFHGLSDSAKPFGRSLLAQVLLVTRLPCAGQVRRCPLRGTAPPIRKRQAASLRRRALSCGTRILTRFPFGKSHLRLALGPTHSCPTNVDKKPLPFRRPGFSPGIAATSAKIFIAVRSTSPHGLASARTARPPTRCPDSLRTFEVSVTGLSPDSLQCHEP